MTDDEEIMRECAARMSRAIREALITRRIFGNRSGADVLAQHHREISSWLFEIGHITLEQYEELNDEIGRKYDAFIRGLEQQ